MQVNIVVYDNVFAHNTVRSNVHIHADLCTRIDDGRGMNQR
jgi:hypothetical protein